jgi:hypothetical protein
MRLGLWLGLTLAAGSGLLPAATPGNERFRSSRVEWTRLQTSDKYWNRHSAGDIELLALMRQHTSLTVPREWHSVRATSLSDLCRYPFIYAADISVLTTEESGNLAEYLKRGGFIFIDACIFEKINPDPRVFLERQGKILGKHLPALRMVELPPSHEIFSLYFQMEKGVPMTRSMGSWSMTENFPLRALMLEDRVVGMISLSGLQCGWAGVGIKLDSHQAENAMKMATNIYIYAMTR